ncbi:MAG: hypothetical protein D6696_13655 [Acidobacteria bacterium]|nr:MAG: hypothetical protein D6696_13655 [Acidobacteriota bacterium]
MQTAPTPSSRAPGIRPPLAPDDSRPGDGRASGSEAIRTDTVLAGSLDALVRAVRAQSPGLSAIARRVASLWREHAGVEVTIEPAALLVGGRVALAANDQEGRWILPTFMSGLRALRAEPRINDDDVLRLADELGRLEPTVESLTAFQDWLWADGAEGFVVDLQPSFVEVMEAVTAMDQGPSSTTGILAVRGDGAYALDGEALAMPAADLDAAAARPELGLPLDFYARGVAERRFAIDDEECARLQAACDDAAAWIGAETLAVLRRPALAQGMPPARLARRIIALASEGVSPQLLSELSQVSQRDDPYATQLFTALEAQRLDEVLGHHLMLDNPETLIAARDFLTSTTPVLARGVLPALIRKAQEQPAALAVLGEVLSVPQAEELLEEIGLAELGADAHVTVARAMTRGGTGTGELSTMLTLIPPRSAAAILADMPRTLLAHMRPIIDMLLASSDQTARESMATTLLELADRPAFELLGSKLLESRGAGWRRGLVRRILRRLVASGHGHLNLALARDPKAPAEVRIMALDSLSSHPALLPRAVRWRLAELVDPPEVRLRLRELRRRLRAQR